MRLAMVTPMPPAKSGIADYSAALAGPLGELAELTVISDTPEDFDPRCYDLVIYQLGNNPHHALAYEMALRHPGVVVLHEANLHHLVVHLTVTRGDWDAYFREVEYEGGAEALARACRARAGEIGPDYDGLPLIRRVLERSQAVIVHSRYVAEQVRAAGYGGPVGVVPHGAWIPAVSGFPYRHKLGLDETIPLVGIFGFLKPYKRITEALHVFRRLVRLEPQAKMILVGEPHPDLPITPLIRRLELQDSVRLLGFVPIEDFTGYMAACDIVLNLRYPTVGETSGSLLRALGLGRAVVVSDVGAFRELPEDICLKVPVDANEEEVLFEYLNLLVAQPTLARQMGERARQWAVRECRWEVVAQKYLSFLEQVAAGTAGFASAATEAGSPKQDFSTTARPKVPEPQAVEEEYILGWAQGDADRAYIETHLSRLEKTLSLIPPGGAEDRILEMGAYLQITPALKTRLGYGEVRGCYYGPAGKVDHKRVVSAAGEVFECDLDLFDAEKDVYPYPDEYFATVLCCEVLEHLAVDPMHMLAEINRVLRPGGRLVLTTPNIASLRAISALLLGYHPGLFSVYLKPSSEPSGEARHHREYTPIEIHLLLEDAGFEVERLETGPFRQAPAPQLAWVRHLLERYRLSTELRGEGIYAVGRKKGAVKNRFPEWLYSPSEQ